MDLRSIVTACASGQLKAAMQILAEQPAILAEVRYDTTVGWIALFETMRNGHFPTFKWLASQPLIDIHFENDQLVKSACIYGRLEIAQWLIRNFPGIDMHSLCGDPNMRKKEHYVLFYTCLRHSDQCENYNSIWWLLGFYTAEKFWSKSVQKICGPIIEDWTREAEPHRRLFMSQIAPYLVHRY